MQSFPLEKIMVPGRKPSSELWGARPLLAHFRSDAPTWKLLLTLRARTPGWAFRSLWLSAGRTQSRCQLAVNVNKLAESHLALSECMCTLSDLVDTHQPGALSLSGRIRWPSTSADRSPTEEQERGPGSLCPCINKAFLFKESNAGSFSCIRFSLHISMSICYVQSWEKVAGAEKSPKS